MKSAGLLQLLPPNEPAGRIRKSGGRDPRAVRAQSVARPAVNRFSRFRKISKFTAAALATVLKQDGEELIATTSCCRSRRLGDAEREMLFAPSGGGDRQGTA